MMSTLWCDATVGWRWERRVVDRRGTEGGQSAENADIAKLCAWVTRSSMGGADRNPEVTAARSVRVQ